jgi:hypothetical protein
VQLSDQRPYGEKSTKKVWLARFDSVMIKAEDGGTANVTLSLAFDFKKGDLICAFTDPTPQWARGGTGFEAQARFTEAGRITSPARYGTLTSTVVQVLSEAWTSSGVDPRQRGQLILRPRFAEFKHSSEESCNVWIVEALGNYIMTRYPPPTVSDCDTTSVVSKPVRGFVLTTHVQAFRDNDLKFMGGLIYF